MAKRRYRSKAVRPSISIPAETFARLKAWAEANRASMTEVVDYVIEKETGNVGN